jgi:RHS repeat-associated protein
VPLACLSGHLFSNKEWDPATGNDYFLARYYSSMFGRFLSPDWSAQEEPVPYASLDDPQSLNLYAYVRNNPLTRVDSDGHAFCPGWCDLSGMAYQTQSETEAAERAYNAQAGYGKVTNAELNKRVADQRAYLVGIAPDDATKAQLTSADSPTIFHVYMCQTHGDCGPTSYDPKFIALTGPEVAGTVDPGSIETHHMLPQNETMKSFFEKRGLDVEDFTKDMTAAEHRLRPNGLHTKGGGDWNGVWEDWIGKNPNATRAQVLRQLEKMKKDFKIK